MSSFVTASQPISHLVPRVVIGLDFLAPTRERRNPVIRKVTTAAIVASLASALLMTAGATSAGADRHHDDGTTNGPCQYTETPDERDAPPGAPAAPRPPHNTPPATTPHRPT